MLDFYGIFHLIFFFYSVSFLMVEVTILLSKKGVDRVCSLRFVMFLT